MHELDPMIQAVRHQVQAAFSARCWSVDGHADRDPTRDRGAVSLEQVLWFVAAGVSVAVIAGLIWSQIREQASTPVLPPSAP